MFSVPFTKFWAHLGLPMLSPSLLLWEYSQWAALEGAPQGVQASQFTTWVASPSFITYVFPEHLRALSAGPDPCVTAEWSPIRSQSHPRRGHWRVTSKLHYQVNQIPLWVLWRKRKGVLIISHWQAWGVEGVTLQMELLGYMSKRVISTLHLKRRQKDPVMQSFIHRMLICGVEIGLGTVFLAPESEPSLFQLYR